MWWLITQNIFRNSLACFYQWKCRVEMWDVRRYYWDWKRNKKDFVFFQLKLVWPNDKDASCVYQLLSFFFQNMNLWHDFLHFVFVSLKSTSLLQILKLVIHSKHSQWMHLLPLTLSWRRPLSYRNQSIDFCLQKQSFADVLQTRCS